MTTIIESGLDIPRATAAGQVDDLAAELADLDKLLASLRSLLGAA